MLEIPANGRCQCGECAYTISANPYVAYTCHCNECQKLSSSAFATLMQVPSESVEIVLGSPKRQKRIAPSGNVLETWFCPSCGSSLFAANSARPRVRTIHTGSLEHAHDIEVSAHIWVKRKLPRSSAAAVRRTDVRMPFSRWFQVNVTFGAATEASALVHGMIINDVVTDHGMASERHAQAVGICLG